MRDQGFHEVYKISRSEDSKDLTGHQNIEMVIIFLIFLDCGQESPEKRINVWVNTSIRFAVTLRNSEALMVEFLTCPGLWGKLEETYKSLGEH